MKMKDRKRIFISHSSKDNEIIVPLIKSLEADYDVVWDWEEPWYGQIKDEIARAIRSACMVIVVWSPNAQSSAWISMEIEIAKKYGIPIYHVCINLPEDLGDCCIPGPYREYVCPNVFIEKESGAVPIEVRRILGLLENHYGRSIFWESLFVIILFLVFYCVFVVFLR